MKLSNVINEPVLTGSSDKLVLDLLNIPELHLLIGRCRFCDFFCECVYICTIFDIKYSIQGLCPRAGTGKVLAHKKKWKSMDGFLPETGLLSCFY